MRLIQTVRGSLFWMWDAFWQETHLFQDMIISHGIDSHTDSFLSFLVAVLSNPPPVLRSKWIPFLFMCLSTHTKSHSETTRRRLADMRRKKQTSTVSVWHKNTTCPETLSFFSIYLQWQMHVTSWLTESKNTGGSNTFNSNWTSSETFWKVHHNLFLFQNSFHSNFFHLGFFVQIKRDPPVFESFSAICAQRVFGAKTKS